jgi:hypothetical protein
VCVCVCAISCDLVQARFLPRVAASLDALFTFTYTMTDNRFNNTYYQVDTGPLRRAVWQLSVLVLAMCDRALTRLALVKIRATIEGRVARRL